MNKKTKAIFKVYIDYIDGTSVSIYDCDEGRMWELLNKIREEHQYIIKQLNITKD